MARDICSVWDWSSVRQRYGMTPVRLLQSDEMLRDWVTLNDGHFCERDQEVQLKASHRRFGMWKYLIGAFKPLKKLSTSKMPWQILQPLGNEFRTRYASPLSTGFHPSVINRIHPLLILQFNLLRRHWSCPLFQCPPTPWSPKPTAKRTGEGTAFALLATLPLS